MIGELRSVVLDAADITGEAAFYTELTGFAQAFADDEWIILKSPAGLRLCFQFAPDHIPPRWPEQSAPQQAHLDLLVPDIDAAAEQAIKLGATRLGGGETWHTVADPAGHPVDLCRGSADGPTEIYAVTIDCPDAGVLARFYAELLGMELRYEGAEGALIGAEQGGWQVMFQNVDGYHPPGWPDPSRPQQYHLDVAVPDVEVAEAQVLALGATRLPGEGGNWRVYADPADHPFCLVW
jgi:catechol 2,3-dioxygenase-like lactoylglutathione lyase family enzyme